MKRLLKDKYYITITTIVLIIILVASISIYRINKIENSDVKCYWTTKGLFCMSELVSK